MKTSTYHNGEVVENSNCFCDTPDELFNWYKRYNGKHGYDLMIGTTKYNVKSCKFANNNTEIVTKVTTNLSKTKER